MPYLNFLYLQRMDYLYFKIGNILPIQNLLENMIWTIINKQTYRNTVNQITMGLLFLNLLEYTDTLYQDNIKTSEQELIFSSLKYVKSHYPQNLFCIQ